MHKQTITIKTYVSDTIYCEQCRFYKVYKGGQTCLLANEILQRDAFGILKHKGCLNCKKGKIEDEQPNLSMSKTMVRQIIRRYDKYFKQCMDSGLPSYLASTEAANHMLEECE